MTVRAASWQRRTLQLPRDIYSSTVVVPASRRRGWKVRQRRQAANATLEPNSVQSKYIGRNPTQIESKRIGIGNIQMIVGGKGREQRVAGCQIIDHDGKHVPIINGKAGQQSRIEAHECAQHASQNKDQVSPLAATIFS